MALSNHTEPDQVIFDEFLGGRKVILNRQNKLNALNYEMLRRMTHKFKTYEKDPTVKFVILKAIGKVFCVGGDLTFVSKFVSIGHWSFATSYYRKLLCLNYILATYKKPMVAILNGGVMGGGVGISIHATFRVVTENTFFAMPEASTGLFPDVGASYFLSRLPGFFGEYMGLTGARLDASEMLAFGLATHYIPSQSLQSMESALGKIVSSSDAPGVSTLTIIVNKFAQKINMKPGNACTRLNMINQCFSGETCEEILSSLECLATRVDEKWIHDAITSMKSATPVGLKIFLRTIREGRNKTFKQCLQTEYIAMSHVLRQTVSNDFYEGCRAMLIDKDKKPQWMPSKLEDVTDQMMAKCFSRSFTEDDDWLPLQLLSKLDEDEVMISKL